MKFKLEFTAAAAALAFACAGASMAQTTTPGAGGGSTMTPSSPSTPPTHPTERTTPSNRMPTNPDASTDGSGTMGNNPDAKSGSQAEAMQACKNLSAAQERKDCMDKARASNPGSDGAPGTYKSGGSPGGTKPNPSGTSSGTGAPQK